MSKKNKFTPREYIYAYLFSTDHIHEPHTELGIKAGLEREFRVTVSRSAIRETLSEMTNSELLISVKGKGSHIVDPSEEYIKLLFDMREKMEKRAIELLRKHRSRRDCLKRRVKPELDVMEKLIADHVKDKEDKQSDDIILQQFHKADMKFHQAILACAGLVPAGGDLKRFQLVAMIYMRGALRNKRNWGKVFEDHQRIYNALDVDVLQGDSYKRLAAAISVHLKKARDWTLRRGESGGSRVRS